MKAFPCFVDETGSLHDRGQPLFAVGALVVRDVATLTDLLHTTSLNFNSRIREKRLALQREISQFRDGQMTQKEMQELLHKTRHHEYKFTEIHPANLQEYLDLLNVFFTIRSSEFHAIFVERNVHSSRIYGSDSWPSYVMVTKQLLKRRLREPSFVCCDWQGKPKKFNLCLEDELDTLPHVAGCLRMTSETSAFLQVVDLLVGCVSFDWRDAHGLISKSNDSEAKRKLVIFVKDRLRMAPTARFLGDGRRYFSRRSPIRFSVWQPNFPHC